MATAAKMTADISAPVLSLSPHDVLVGERLGAFWPDKAAAIGQLMAEDGQNEPIKVRANGPRAAKPWTLVAGHHRLEGAMLAGLVLTHDRRASSYALLCGAVQRDHHQGLVLQGSLVRDSQGAARSGADGIQRGDQRPLPRTA